MRLAGRTPAQWRERLPRGVRVRLTVMYALAAVVLTLLGSGLGLLSLQIGVRSNLDNDLNARLAVLVSGLREAGPTGLEQLIDPSVREDVPASISAYRRPDGTLLTVTGTRLRALHVPASFLQQRPGQIARVTIGHDQQRLRLVAEGVRRPDGVWVAIAGTSVHQTDEVVHDVAHAMILAAPLIVILTAIGTWLLAGAALRPVDRMRGDAAALAVAPERGRLQVPGTRDELAALATTLNELLERLQRSLARQQEFVADAGHELRTPLAVLRMELELAARPGRSREELVDALGHAEAEAARLSELADAMLFLARADGGAALVRPEPTELGPLLAAAARSVRAKADLAGVELDTDLEELTAPVDATAVRRAVDNLLSNAIEHSPPGGTVRLTTARSADGRAAVIAVEDEGPGFPAGFLPHAFERFQRADAARSHSTGHLGAGLGLAIVAEVAAAHGGTADVGNRPGGGAYARIVLPNPLSETSPQPTTAATPTP